MTDTNHVVLVGRLTRDLGTDERSFAYTAGGTARASVSVAVNRSVKRGEEWVDEVSYFDITIWGKTAENLKPYLTKGKQIAVSGYMKQDRWQEKDTGNSRSKVYIVADTVQLLGGKDDNAADKGEGYGKDGGYQGFQKNEARSADAEAGMDEFPEDIPF